MIKIEYHSASIDNEGKIKFIKFELKTNAYVNVIWSIFQRYTTKGVIEMDATIVKSTNNILKMLKRPELTVSDKISCYIIYFVCDNKNLC